MKRKSENNTATEQHLSSGNEDTNDNREKLRKHASKKFLQSSGKNILKYKFFEIELAVVAIFAQNILVYKAVEFNKK